LGALEFCEAVQPLLERLQSSAKIGFMDDVTLLGDLVTIEKDIITITESSPDTGLHLNTSKCDLIMEDLTPAEGLATLKDFVRVNKEDMTLLGAEARLRTQPSRRR